MVKNDFQRAFKHCDILIAPTMPTPAFKIGEIQDPLTMYKMDVNTVPINLAGIPALSMPMGFVKGLPVGLQVMGNYFEENKILSFALELERELV